MNAPCAKTTADCWRVFGRVKIYVWLTVHCFVHFWSADWYERCFTNLFVVVWTGYLDLKTTPLVNLIFYLYRRASFFLLFMVSSNLLQCVAFHMTNFCVRADMYPLFFLIKAKFVNHKKEVEVKRKLKSH